MDKKELNHRIKRFLNKKSRKFPNLNYEFSSRYYGVAFDEEELEHVDQSKQAIN